MPAEQLTVQAARVDHRADVADGQIVHDPRLTGFEIHFDFGEAGDERVGVAVVRIGVLRHAHHTDAGQR